MVVRTESYTAAGRLRLRCRRRGPCHGGPCRLNRRRRSHDAYRRRRAESQDVCDGPGRARTHCGGRAVAAGAAVAVSAAAAAAAAPAQSAAPDAALLSPVPRRRPAVCGSRSNPGGGLGRALEAPRRRLGSRCGRARGRTAARRQGFPRQGPDGHARAPGDNGAVALGAARHGARGLTLLRRPRRDGLCSHLDGRGFDGTSELSGLRRSSPRGVGMIGSLFDPWKLAAGAVRGQRAMVRYGFLHFCGAVVVEVHS